MPAQTVIKLRRDTAADWTTVDPILADGELGIETDTNRIKIGDGTTEWTGLKYGPVSDELVIRVKNASNSVAIPAGRLVQFAGAAGDTVTAEPAVTDGSVDFHYLIGVTAAEIPADGFGSVVLSGPIDGLNTSSYTAGTLLYASAASAGQLTSTAPAAPAFGEPVAAVTRQGSGTSGRILVRMHLGSSLETLHDVQLDTPTSGQVLQFDGTKWINADQFALPDQTGNSGKYLKTDGTDASWADVVTEVTAAIVDSAPSTLDTLNELAAALGDDADFATTVTSALGGKQDKVSGVSDTEIGYLDGVTSGIQGQLDGKANSTNPEFTTEGLGEIFYYPQTSAMFASAPYILNVYSTTTPSMPSVGTVFYIDSPLLEGIPLVVTSLSNFSPEWYIFFEAQDSENSAHNSAIESYLGSSPSTIRLLGEITLTVTSTEIGYLDGVTSNIQDQLDGKQDKVSGVSDTEIGYLDGVTSAIQTQLDGKAAVSHSHNGSAITYTIEDKTANYTIVATDEGKVIRSTGSAITVTVADVFAIGEVVTFTQYGAGQITFTPAGGVTLHSVDSKRKTNKQYSTVQIMKTAAATYLLFGDIAA